MSESLAAWNGYVFDRPRSPRWEGVYPGPEMALRRLLWARLLSQVDKRPSNPMLSPALDHSARDECRFCGWGAGLERECPDGHRWFTPLGCGTRWCLRCAGTAADLRAMRVHGDLCELSDLAAALGPVRPAVLRIQLTLADGPRAQVIEGGRQAANDLLHAARRVLVDVAGSDGTMPIMLTLHPTKTRQPWIKAPHVHAVVLWCDIDADGVRPLSWSAPGRPIDAEALREAWGDAYSGSKVVRAAWYSHDDESGAYTRPTRTSPQSLASAVRYDLRPFTEDVWAAVADRRLGIPGDSMNDLLNCWRPATLRAQGDVDDADLPDALSAAGGVLLWPRWHRVRRYGALASRGYAARVEHLHEMAGLDRAERSPVCECPICGEALACVRVEDDDGEPTQWPSFIRRSTAQEMSLGLLPGPGLIREPQEVPA